MAQKEAAKKTETAVKKAAEKIVETEKAVEKAVVKAASKTAEKAAEKKTVTRKKAAPAAKKAEMATEVFVQYWGKEVNAAEVTEQIKKIWTDEMKKDLADLKELKIYVKPEDDGAHYVINGEITGFIKF